MPTYQPILKAKPAEFSAWENATTAERLASRPLFELAPSEKVENYLNTFVTSAKNSVNGDEVLTVDASAIEQDLPWATGMPRIIEWLGAELASRSVKMRPVARLTDSATVLADIGAVAALHKSGVTIRLGTDSDDPNLSEFIAKLPRLLVALGLNESQLHVLLDFRYIAMTKDVSRAVPTLDAWLVWLATRPTGFASVHAGAGAFPSSISSLPLATANRLQRHDAAFYNAATVPTGFDLGFADYAVNNPLIGPVVPRGPLPSLRYLVDDSWLVWREQSPIGNEGFFTVCAAIVADSAWKGPAFSWGDGQIERSARSVGGAGTATHWRAYGTSHHVAEIVDRLANFGAP